MLLDVEREESAVRSGEREAVGALAAIVKRRGWALRSVGRRERCERKEVLRMRIVLEYSMNETCGWCSAGQVGSVTKLDALTLSPSLPSVAQNLPILECLVFRGLSMLFNWVDTISC
jgi:hypothetical protein